MQPDAVVKANKIVSNVVCCLEVIGIVFLLNPLHLQIQEDALHHRAFFVIYPTIAVAAHAAHQAIFFQQLLVLSAGILRSPV